MKRLGIDLGGTKIAVAVIDAGGEVIFEKRLPTPVDDYGQTLRVIAALVAQAEVASGMPAGSARVGVGSPGAESLIHGRIKNANSTALNGQSLARDLTELLKRQVRVANDANCMTLSEATDGAAANQEVVFGVILGTGVGGGLVIRNHLIGGVNRIAGEWGHNPLPWPDADERPGPACYCGQSGCIETWLSGPGLLAEYQRREGGEPVDDAATVCALALAGDQTAGAVLITYYRRLARALASAINFLDPDVIVLAGGLSNHLPIYREVPTLWGQWVFSDRVDTRLLPARHGDASGVRGAAWLWPG
ncbi:MAG: ROK family protein [Gammaproteobacteria bacterium]